MGIAGHGRQPGVTHQVVAEHGRTLSALYTGLHTDNAISMQACEATAGCMHGVKAKHAVQITLPVLYSCSVTVQPVPDTCAVKSCYVKILLAAPSLILTSVRIKT